MSDKREQYYYLCKSRLIPARRYAEVYKIAWRIYKLIKRKTKRRPYIRSAYFKGTKIFFDYFWVHLNTKHSLDRLRRLKYFECAIELIQNSKIKPFTELISPDGKEKLYRFLGKTKEHYFIVQIKQDYKREQKFLISIFPYEK